MTAILNRDLLRRCARTQSVCSFCRGFTSSSPSFAGHNRWSQIKHDKAKNDKAKSKERQIIGKEISSATQMWGADPKFNPRLTLALSNAKRAGIPKTVIEAAIARGQGISVTGEALEQVTIEAILPHSVAAVIECQTDQKARILQDLRYAIKDAGGTVTPTTYLFEKKGRIVFEKKDGLNPDDYLDQAIEAGAMDITADEEGRLIVFTEPTETKSVGEALTKSSQLTIEELEIIWDPNQETLVELTEDEHVREIEDILSTLREESSVRDIYLNTTQQL
ncbi:transcriptional regulator TACO1-like protein [Aspergillus caelatus]|uniref:Transcriptional regulator TACO1-like protein n=1 Tax=Aspergillus caelatus TaxID=61420 RepID=A0A5N7AGT7_9EURO|nr:transcriptional regulator TACO1-like protein [Aspergillus caelatus]KAE8369081.1 transcriptional regulator TACO1-like protein [Aspergillus caelatus]